MAKLDAQLEASRKLMLVPPTRGLIFGSGSGSGSDQQQQQQHPANVLLLRSRFGVIVSERDLPQHPEVSSASASASEGEGEGEGDDEGDGNASKKPRVEQ